MYISMWIIAIIALFTIHIWLPIAVVCGILYLLFWGSLLLIGLSQSVDVPADYQTYNSIPPSYVQSAKVVKPKRLVVKPKPIKTTAWPVIPVVKPVVPMDVITLCNIKKKKNILFGRDIAYTDQYGYRLVYKCRW